MDNITVLDYLRGCTGYPVSMDVCQRILLDNILDANGHAEDLTFRQRDFLKMSAIEAVLLMPSMTQSVADADGLWSHKEGATESNAVDRAFLRKQLNALKKKWGIAVGSSIKLHSLGMRMHK